MAPIEMTLEAFAAALGVNTATLGRLERAIVGDPTLGTKGLVHRLGDLEALSLNEGTIHGDIERRRSEGDRRSHERIEGLEDQVEARLRAIEIKLDRAIWLAFGAFVGGGLIGGGSVWAALGA